MTSQLSTSEIIKSNDLTGNTLIDVKQVSFTNGLVFKYYENKLNLLLNMVLNLFFIRFFCKILKIFFE